MASPCLLGWAVSEVTCRDTVRLLPGMFKQLAPTCTSYVIPHTSKHSRLTRHERKKKKERCAHIPKSQITRLRKAQRCSGNSVSKTTGWECGTLGLESETVCELCGFPASQPSVLRQRRRVAGEFVILTTLAPSEAPLLQQEPCRSLFVCE